MIRPDPDSECNEAAAHPSRSTGVLVAKSNTPDENFKPNQMPSEDSGTGIVADSTVRLDGRPRCIGQVPHHAITFRPCRRAVVDEAWKYAQLGYGL